MLAILGEMVQSIREGGTPLPELQVSEYLLEYASFGLSKVACFSAICVQGWDDDILCTWRWDVLFKKAST